ncbi:LysR family transcriptional regulator [Gellertiella hungarica]|uniref:DNA-binding transcriptional LysR family regulator n=1 Tax=Gellertiella hungarica TaxID=1572859 RepID=A0A7W6J8F3_9HYPH|nr:LysR family transcriptional regulator [Gellertiella hungarica]MBB4066657.1 DNA-binding transcriptional LysR family regulator [Gellertiella hungarica]
MKEIQRRLIPSTAALTAFEAVARLGSFSAAANALSLTPGAVSRHVDGLEGQLGVVLVKRTNKGVELTEKGRRYAAGVAEIIDRLRLLSLDAMSNIHPGQLDLAILPTFGTRWLLPRIPDFVSTNTDVTLNFVTRIGRVDFERDRLDAAIHVGRPFSPDLVFEHLMPEVAAPVCSPAFRAANAIAAPAALLDMPLLEMVSRPDGWRNWFAAAGIAEPYREGMRFEQFIHVAQACMTGLGVALMPLILIQSELESGQLVELDVPRFKTGNGYYLVYPRHKADNPSVRRFSAWLLEQARRFVEREEQPGQPLSAMR